VATQEKSCKVSGCKRPYRAKGFCNVHYAQWRKGKLPKSRYKTCHFGVNKLKRGEKKECLKPVFRRGLCEKHYQEASIKKESAPAAGAAAPAPAAE
jgi:hypothetical protein